MAESLRDWLDDLAGSPPCNLSAASEIAPAQRPQVTWRPSGKPPRKPALLDTHWRTRRPLPRGSRAQDPQDGPAAADREACSPTPPRQQRWSFCDRGKVSQIRDAALVLFPLHVYHTCLIPPQAWRQRGHGALAFAPETARQRGEGDVLGAHGRPNLMLFREVAVGLSGKCVKDPPLDWSELLNLREPIRREEPQARKILAPSPRRNRIML